MLFNQNQQDMRAFYSNGTLLLAGLMFLLACNHTPNCRVITGAWSDREGHDFEFQENGKALWLNKFGHIVDTVRFAFVLNCEAKPATIEFTDFSGGPFSGKTLFGIIEWSADSLFRICYDIGQESGCRPKQFDPEQTMKFYR